MMQTFKMTVAAATIGLLTVLPASAATISWGDGSTPGDNLNPTSFTAPVKIDATASTFDALSPFAGSSLDGEEFNSVGADGTMTYVFASMRSTLTFIWGSVDTYNYLDFYKGAVWVGQFGGTAVGAPFGGNRDLSEILASIVVNGGFDKVVFSSPGANAFEHASVAAVPVPAAGFLLIGALGGLAALRRRKTAA